MTQIAQKLEEYGYDLLDCDAGCYEAYFYSNPPYYMPKCYELYLAKEVKKVVNIPVFMTGKMTDPDICEQAIADGELDGVSLGRASMADPHFPNKVFMGHPETIRPCIACTNCLDTMNKEGLPKCSVNPSVFLEHDYALGETCVSKKVIVVGGGIAGMAAACFLTQRGHYVELYERNGVLGGLLPDEFAYSFKSDVKDLYTWYLSEIDRLKINVQLNSPLTVEKICAMNPDAVILATGSTYRQPTVPGADHQKVIQLTDAIHKRVPVGQKVVVVGSNLAGSELAYELAANMGKQVTLIESNASLLTTKPFVAKPARDMLLELLKDKKVEAITGATVKAVTDAGVVITDSDGKESVIAADSVVFSLGMESKPSMERDLVLSGIEAFSVGDEAEPGNIRSCIFGAYDIAKML